MKKMAFIRTIVKYYTSFDVHCTLYELEKAVFLDFFFFIDN